MDGSLRQQVDPDCTGSATSLSSTSRIPRSYTHEQLMDLRFTNASKRWPIFLDDAFKNLRGVWDPDRWHQGKRDISPIQDPAVASVGEKIPLGGKLDNAILGEGKARRESKDPRERIKAEQADAGGIVLSPQRRSFLTGCSIGATSGKPSTRKSEEISLRPADVGNNNRRFGSGRIANRDSGENDDRDHYDRRDDQRFGGFRRDDKRGGRPDVDRRNEVMDKTFRRDYIDSRSNENDYGRPRQDKFRGGYDDEYNNDRWSGRGRGGDDERHKPRDSRFGGGRKQNEEPEWMSATIDQDELMELHGFNDSPEKAVNESKVKGKTEAKESLDKNKEPTPPNAQQLEQEFNIDDILHMDVIPGLSLILDDRDGLDSGMLGSSSKTASTHSASNTGGRFSQFFHSSNQPQALTDGGEKLRERRSSIQDEFGIDKNMLADGSSIPTVQIPDHNIYFAPISPAGKTATPSDGPTSTTTHHPNPLLNMLNTPGDFPSLVVPSMEELRGKQVRSVEELEADIRQMASINDSQSVHNQRRQEQQQPQKAAEMTAFEKFAALVSDGQPADRLSIGNQTSHNVQIHHPQLGLIRPSPLPANAPTERDILAGMSGPRPVYPSTVQANPLHELLRVIHDAPFHPEILKRPDALALQAAINSGRVSFETLVQHFAEGDMPPQQREVLLNVLKVAQAQGYLGPMFNKPAGGPFHCFIGGFNTMVPPQTQDPVLLLAAAQQQQRLSPGLIQRPGGLTVSPTPGTQRIPSPQELVVHTQQIMQNALIKQKLAEQAKNYRRRQEISSTAQENSKLRGTNSPLAFAPTAVMKKIAAERRDSDPSGTNKSVLPELKISQNNEKAESSFSRISPPQPQQQMFPHSLSSQMLIQHLRMQHGNNLAALQQATSPTFLEQQRLMALQQQQQQREFLFQQQQQHLQMAVEGGQSSLPGASLSRFFSSEVLAQVSAGNAPPPMPTQSTKSVDEIERQMAAIVRM